MCIVLRIVIIHICLHKKKTALETSHAIYQALVIAPKMRKDQDILICLSGRGDKDVQTVAETLPKYGPLIGWDLRF